MQNDNDTTHTTPFPKRHRFKWSHSEVDDLYQEFELKNYGIQEIAELHERTYNSIIYKLQSEK